MEYLGLIKAALAGNWVAIALFVAPFVLPNKWLYGVGFAGGKIASAFLLQKIGRGGEKVERYLQGTLAAIVGGLTDGLDLDDTPNVK